RKPYIPSRQFYFAHRGKNATEDGKTVYGDEDSLATETHNQSFLRFSDDTYTSFWGSINVPFAGRVMIKGYKVSFNEKGCGREWKDYGMGPGEQKNKKKN